MAPDGQNTVPRIASALTPPLEINAMSIKVFLSYANVKDLDGTVTAFHAALDQAIKGRFDMDARVFMDKRDIRAGDNWKDSLSGELATSNVLVVLLSPVWLSREWCRAEFIKFQTNHPAGQYKNLVIPLVWAATGASDAKNDESKKVLKDIDDIQKIDWLDLQYDRNYTSSTDLRKAIGKLADEIKYRIESSAGNAFQ